jgi:hypothetical protein
MICRLSNGSALKIVRKETLKSMNSMKNAISIWAGAEDAENYGIYPD